MSGARRTPENARESLLKPARAKTAAKTKTKAKNLNDHPFSFMVGNLKTFKPSQVFGRFLKVAQETRIRIAR